MNAATVTSPLYYMSFSIAASLVCLTCLVYMGLHRRFDKLQSKVFIVIILDLAISAACDVMVEYVGAYTSVANAALIIELADYFYYIAHAALAPLFFLYVRAVCGATTRMGSWRTQIIGLPFYITELIALSNPVTHWMFTHTADLAHVRGWGVIVVYAAGALYFVASFVYLISRWNALTTMKRRALVYFFAMAGAGILIQMLEPKIHVELFMEAMAIVGVMMFVESEEDVMDYECHVYNRNALKMDLDMYAARNLEYSVIAVRVMNVGVYARVGGMRATQAVTVDVAQYLASLMPWYRVYRTAPSRFVLVNPDLSEQKMSAIAHQIADRFDGTWEYRGAVIDLDAVVVHARVPQELQTSEDVFYLTDTPVPTAKDKRVLEGDDLSYLMRRAQVERAVQNGFDEGGYEVYYQPIFGADGKPRAAEALMRLTDKELGTIPPYEFIEVAERMGDIERIGDFALNEVCAFLASGEPQALGIAQISVNLSMIQCMRVDFSKHAEEIVDSHGVAHGEVIYEITESMASGDYEFLSRVMGSLQSAGHLFAMDDYGTGYSNMHSLLALNFDTVKIDKSILWDAEKSDTGRALLENSVLMMRRVGSRVLVEGVETATQVELLQQLGVDFYQGFFFAKPMPKREFVEFCKRFA